MSNNKVIPFSKEEYEKMSRDEIFKYIDEKNPRMYPYCLVGYDLDDARELAKKHNPNNQLVIEGMPVYRYGTYGSENSPCIVVIDEKNIVISADFSR